MTSYDSYGSYGSDLNNTRRRIEYREGYKKKEKTSICTPCCLGILGMLMLLALLTGLFFLIKGISHDTSSNQVTQRPQVDYIGTKDSKDL